MVDVTLKRGKEKPIRRYHPWVFSGAIANIPSSVNAGSLVRVCNANGLFCGIGYYTDSSISIRIISFEDQAIDISFWSKLLAKAYQKRTSWGVHTKRTNAFRWIHGEGDNIPGLIIDVYDTTIVVQYHNEGIYALRSMVLAGIENTLDGFSYSIHERIVGTWESNDLAPQQAIEPEVRIKENDLDFCVNVHSGQKTGFFLDQRDNRSYVQSISMGKDVCNLFCYTGAFSIYAHRGGATKVTSVDISDEAIAQSKKNAALNNQNENHEFLVADVMKILENNTLEPTDIMIVDPPAFAKSQKKKHNAVKAYQRLNVAALRLVKPGGRLLTFSCSQVIDPYLFENTIRSAAIISGRNIQILKYFSQGADHPVNIYCPEGHYLKGLSLYVE